MITYAGKEWVANSFKFRMSDFGGQVADLLGALFRGIYHIQESVADTDWTSEQWIEVKIYGSHSTFDCSALTDLVILCHDRCIRCEIKGVRKGFIKLCFSPRKREGAGFERHPTIEEAIQRVRGMHGYPDGERRDDEHSDSKNLQSV